MEQKRDELNIKQKKFCLSYLIDFNATRAAIEAGYSKRSAYSIGNALLKKHEVRAFIKQYQDELADSFFVNQSHIIFELARYAFRQRGSSFKDVTAKDSIVALNLLGKHLGMFQEKEAVPVELPYEKALKEAFKKLDEKRDAIRLEAQSNSVANPSKIPIGGSERRD